MSMADILSDFGFIMENPNCIMVGYFANGTLEGILGFFVNPDNNWADCMGPFFANEWDMDKAQDMFAYAKSKLAKAERFNFFFDTNNKNLHQLMALLPTVRNDNEYILLLENANYMPQYTQHNIVSYSSNYRNDIVRLKNKTWPESYITDSDLLNSIGKDREVFCALDENSNFVGYGILKRYNDSARATAEFFVVEENARGKGYGWALLNKVVDCAINVHNANIIDLVVDRLNTHARDLYYSCGFKLSVENASYCIKKLTSSETPNERPEKHVKARDFSGRK